MAPPKHLIVGGLGNLGRTLQKNLLQNGVAVYTMDQPSAVKRKNSRRAVQDASIQVPPFTLGVDSHKKLCQLLENVETVYSLATPDIQFGTVQEFETTNIKGIQHLVAACQQVGVTKLIYGSCAMAVTNSFVDTHSGNEEDPLPPLDSYQSHYDLSKRLGEEHVLSANNDNHLQTCALRLGTIIGGQYTFRAALTCPGKIFAMDAHSCQPRDCLSVEDASRALCQAHKNMDRAKGRAINVTKSKDEISPAATETLEHIGKILDWPVQQVPSWLVDPVKLAMKFQYSLSSPLMQDPPGCPPPPLSRYPQARENL